MQSFPPRPPTTRKGTSGAGGGGHSSVLDMEDTILIIKPDAVQHHAAILQAVSETGLQITMQSFTLTQIQADVVVRCYPSVSSAMEFERFSSIVDGTNGKGGGGMSDIDGVPDSNRGTGFGFGSNRQRRQNSDLHNEITNEIMKLSRRGGNSNTMSQQQGGAGGTSGAASAAGAASGVASINFGEHHDQFSASSSSGTSPGGINNYSNRPQRSPPVVIAPSSPVGSSRKASQSKAVAKDLAREHIKHLVAGGTCLALLVSGPNAVSVIELLCGPEDPDEARNTSPKSLRARYGTDIVRNAVFAALNVQDASNMIRSVFGIEGRRLDGKRRGAQGGGDNERREAQAGSTWMEAMSSKRSWSHQVGVDPLSSSGVGSATGRRSSRPPVDSVHFDNVGDMILDGVNVEAEAQPDMIVDALFEVGSNLTGGGIQRRAFAPLTSSRIPNAVSQKDGQAADEAAVASNGSGQHAVGGGGASPHTHGGGHATAELARVLAEERKKLLHQSKALRVREMDLLLREQELFRIATSLGVQAAGGGSSVISPRQGFDTLSKSSSVRDAIDPLISPMHGGASSSSMMSSWKKFAPEKFATVPQGPMVREEDLEGLIYNPKRLGYLFNMLDHRKHGCITGDDVMFLYLRSSCLHLVGHENDVELVIHLLEKTVPNTNEISLEQFTMIMMRLIRM